MIGVLKFCFQKDFLLKQKSVHLFTLPPSKVYPMNRLLSLVFLLFLGYAGQAQQLSLFTQYRENTTVINPAALEGDFLGFGQNISFGASYRAQWVGLENGPTTQVVRGTYFNPDMRGVALMAGGHIINDQTGPTGFTGIYGRIGGIVSSDPEYSGLSIGLSFGMAQFRLNAADIILREDNDVLGSNNQTKIYPDVGLGIYYYTTLNNRSSDYVYGGVSIPQVFGLDLTFQDENGEYATQRVQHFYGLLGMYKFFDNNSFIEPSVWIKRVAGAPLSVDFNLRYQLPVPLWIGAGGSTGNAVHLETGVLLGDSVGFSNTFKLGYGFDYSFNSFGPTAGTTHEINLTFSLDR